MGRPGFEPVTGNLEAETLTTRFNNKLYTFLTFSCMKLTPVWEVRLTGVSFLIIEKYLHMRSLRFDTAAILGLFF